MGKCYMLGGAGWLADYALGTAACIWHSARQPQGPNLAATVKPKPYRTYGRLENPQIAREPVWYSG